MLNSANPEDAYLFGYSSSYNVRRMSRNRPNKKGLIKIEIEIKRYAYDGTGSYKRDRTYVDTRIWVAPKNWNNSTEKLSVKEDGFDTKNNKINQVFSAVQSYVSSKGSQDPDQVYIENVDFSKLKGLFPSRKENRKTLVDYIDDYYQRRKNLKHKRGTVKEFLTVKNRIEKFDKSRNKKTYLLDLNITWSDDFEIWMLKENYASGTIEKTYTILRTVLYFLWEVRDEQETDITEKFKSIYFKRGDKSKNKANPLTEEQITTLYNHQFDTDRLNKTKKMMCIQAFTGMRYADIKRIRPDNIINGYLFYRPEKTEGHEIDVKQPLNAYSKALISEVGNDTSIYDYRNQPYNRNIIDILSELKKQYPALNYKTDHSSHNMRDTFISLAVEKGVNWKSIISWVGHRTYTMMDRYVSLSEPFEIEEMKKLYG